MDRKVLLMILDGWGEGKHDHSNAIYTQGAPFIDTLRAKYPMSHLQACGEYVGLPDGQMGNSEVGHMNLGAGRVVYQDLMKINKACREHKLLDRAEVKGVYDYVKQSGKKLHLLGLCSRGGVHSSLEHYFEFLNVAKEYGLEDVYVHCFMDGRDVPPTSGIDYIRQLKAKMEELGVGQIATIEGRYYAMDRDNRYERVVQAYSAMVYGEGEYNPDPVDAMQKSYDAGVTDEFIVPVVITKDACIQENDSIIFANFRPDRAREITRTFVDPEFSGFERRNGCFPVYYVCMTQYDATMPNVHVAFKPQSLTNTFGE